MKILAGTSGFSYKAWKGSFYPEGLADKAMLGYYAEQLPAVEINNTFYRLPKASLLAAWAEHNVALVIVDTGGGDDPPRVATADWDYLRLRREAYDAAALADWHQWVAARAWTQALVFFKHEDAGTGPRLAAEFLELAD